MALLAGSLCGISDGGLAGINAQIASYGRLRA
jgi:hypothetical protein